MSAVIPSLPIVSGFNIQFRQPMSCICIMDLHVGHSLRYLIPQHDRQTTFFLHLLKMKPLPLQVGQVKIPG